MKSISLAAIAAMMLSACQTLSPAPTVAHDQHAGAETLKAMTIAGGNRSSARPI